MISSTVQSARNRFVRTLAAAALATATCFSAVRAADTAPTFLYSFGGSSDGAYPQANLIEGTDGYLYGTAQTGGSAHGLDGAGVVFKMAVDGTMTTLHAFATPGTDGSEPSPTLVQGSDGALYGTTAFGGSKGAGTVFKVTAGGTFTSLYSFTGGADGGTPTGLAFGSDGNLYGTTTLNGASGYGTVFRVTTNGTLVTLHSFTGSTDGASPQAPPVQGSDGAFYGTTAYGGKTASYAGYGTVYRITTAGALTTLYTFTGGADGSSPSSQLAASTDGKLYGTTPRSAAGTNRGTAFQITTAGALTTLHAFSGGTDGDSPDAGVVQAADGTLYGVTGRDSLANTATADGTLYSLTTDGTLTTLYTFSGKTSGVGYAPHTRLVQGTDGNLYGTTVNGGAKGYGTVFQLTGTGSPVSATSGKLSFTTTAYNAVETDGTATITVSRTGSGTGAASVSYAVSAGTAVGGTDFVAASGTLTWADGDTGDKSFLVAVKDNPVSRDSHTVLLTLASPVGSATLGNLTSATLTIADADAPVVASTVAITVGGDGLAIRNGKKGKIRFVRTGDTSAALTINYTLKGSAVNGTDYVGSDGQPLSGAVTIPAGSTLSKLKIVALTTPTASKTIKLTLQAGTASAYTVGSPLKAKLILAGTDSYSF